MDNYEPNDAPPVNEQDSNPLDRADSAENCIGDLIDGTTANCTCTGVEIVQSFKAVMQRAAATSILKIPEILYLP